MPDPALLDALLAGNTAATARAVSIVENTRDGFEALLAALHPRLGRARRIGITGPPGAGKSTLVERLVAAYRTAQLRVAVVAVDPTSPFTGGALLGDRIRMESIALDPGVFIRSMATRHSLGGLATATGEVCDVLDAAGFDRLLIETVGVGQSELDVSRWADSTVLVMVPESGDGIQALKSGVIEAADLFVVNKGDRTGADRLRRELQLALDLRLGTRRNGSRVDRTRAAHHSGAAMPDAAESTVDETGAWRPPVLVTSAVNNDGTDKVVGALDTHWQWLTSTGTLDARRRERLLRRTRDAVDRAARRWTWHDGRADAMITAQLEQLRNGQTSPYALAAEVVATLKEGVPA